MDSRNTLHARSSSLLLLFFVALVGSLFLTGSAVAQEKRHLRHILVKSEPIADAIIRRLDAGGDFKELARKYSLDVGTKPLGGDLDWGVPASFEPAFSQVAFNIPNKGGYAKAKSPHGWHVILYVDSAPAPAARPPQQPDPGSPTPPGVKPQPNVVSERNEDIKVEMIWPKADHASGEPLRFMIQMTNQTAAPLEVMNPKLWPLGLLVRYQFGRMNQQFAAPESWDGGPPPGGLSRTLGAGETLREQFVLQDYFGERADWPIIRMIWRGDTLFGRLEKLFPTVVESREYPRRKARWRYYITEESRASILPEYKADDRWFLCLFSRGKIWIELHDPKIPNLVEEFLVALRNGAYDDRAIMQYESDDHFAVIMDPSENPIPFRQPGEGIAWEQGVVGLGLEWVERKPYIGRSLAFGLERPGAVSARAVPIGRIVHVEGEPIVQITKVLDEKKFPAISLALAYPQSLVPEAVLEAADNMPPTRRFDRKIDPSPKSGWQPVISKQEDMKRPERAKPLAPDQKSSTVLAKDLPRVEVETNKGTFLVELYEDDAPNTVANFISLIEGGAYTGTEVNRKIVTDYNRGFVQMGSPDGTTSGHPGYFIRDEPNVRRHLTGVLSMARHAKKPHTGGSQFFICLDGQPHLDGTFTPFGHVIRGIEVVDKLEEKDTIEQMTIVRKRPHEYQPDRLPAD